MFWRGLVMDGSVRVSAVDSAVDNSRKAIDTEDLGVFEAVELESETSDSAETEAPRNVDNDLVGNDLETGNIY